MKTGPAHTDPGVRIGHVHLKVADLGRALDFYCGVLGFELRQRFGASAAFVAAGGYHHHIGLNTWESAGGRPPPPGSTGLFHLAILYPTRAALADALRRLQRAGIPLDGASDHGVSEALYLRDPDENGVEASIGTGRRRNGRATAREASPCSPDRLISPDSCAPDLVHGAMKGIASRPKRRRTVKSRRSIVTTVAAGNCSDSATTQASAKST